MKQFSQSTKAGGKKFFGNFSPVSAGQWKRAIEKDLNGADYEKKLVWKPGDEMSVNPFYSAGQTKNLKLFPAPAPGNFPFTRELSKWKICEDVPPLSTPRAAAMAAKGVDGGADWVLFRNLKIRTAKDFAKLLSKTDLAKTGVCFAPARGSVRQAELFEKSVSGKKSADLAGFFLCDPIGSGEKDETERLAKLIKRFDKRTNGYGCVGVNGAEFHNSGATAAQEAAFALALGAEYLVALGKHGVPARVASQSMVFHFAVGSVFFMEIAKLRAARAVWAHIVERFDPRANGRMRIHASVSALNKSICDPEVNILRATGEAMAAIVGGCNSLSIPAFDGRYRNAEKSQAVARNTQLILKEECGLHRVADPGAGSYYIDALTDKLADAVLRLFLEIEKRGGFAKCLADGFIKQRLSDSAKERARKIAEGKESLIGVNRYPIENERVADRIKVKPGGAGGEFEILRAETERGSRGRGAKFPSVFLVQTGDPAMRSARTVFSTNFFAAAGFEITDGGVFSSPRSAAAAAVKSRADVFVVCSEDSAYADFVPPFARALKRKMKNAFVTVAGNLAENDRRACEKAGVDEFIHIRSNILETLKKTQKAIGIGGAEK
ncbi:methylmalonyl-CoA mutase family protein [Candidatus Mycalebacterium sp.]